MTAFLLERGVFCDPLKEILKGLAQVDDRHLGRVFGDLEHPGKLVPFDGVQLTPQRGVGRFRQGGIGFPRPLLLLPFCQSPVVGKPRDARRLAKVRFLDIVGIEGHLMGENHDDACATACFTPSNNFWFFRERLP